MKIKYAIVYAALAVAFVAVSLWVILSGGKNAKAVKAKFRLGGLMLAVASLLAMTSCAGRGGVFQPMCYDTPNTDPEPTCYEPVEREYVDPSPDQTDEGGEQSFNGMSTPLE